jgi:hypothetical protein
VSWAMTPILGRSWAGWLAAGALPGRTHGDGSTGLLGRLQGEARFQPKAAKKNRKLSLFQKLSIKSKPI